MKTRRHYPVRRLLIVTLVLLGLGIWGGVILFSNSPRYNNLEDVRRATNLVVVLPDALPRNAIITDHPVHDATTSSIVTRMTIDGNSVTFTQQKRPEADLKQIDTQDTFLVNAGSAYILKGESEKLQAIVETSDSWLIVNADAKLGVGAFKKLLESLDAI